MNLEHVPTGRATPAVFGSGNRADRPSHRRSKKIASGVSALALGVTALAGLPSAGTASAQASCPATFVPSAPNSFAPNAPASMVFDKNGWNAPPFNGRADANKAGILALYQQVAGGVCRHDARAGSGADGLLERQTKGPIPTGRYTLGSTDRAGRLISGWRTLVTMVGYRPGQAKSSGRRATLRTDLYIHSEMPPDGNASNAYLNPPPSLVLPSGRTLAFSPARQTVQDSPALWDGEGDFASLGCIKIAPANVAILIDFLGSLNSNGIPLQVVE